MTPVVLKLLTKAAKERRRAAIRYNGQHHLRVVEPHVIYMDDEGSIVADCYQVKGHSVAGKAAPFWKTFRVNKINAVFLLNAPFEAAKAQGFRLNKQNYSRGLIAMAYDRPPTYPERHQGRDSDGLVNQTRSWWTQVESAIDGFLSDEENQGQQH
ncbi:MAG: hypothetical protein ACE5K1_05765 [Acidiferrobacterales bacterium]